MNKNIFFVFVFIFVAFFWAGNSLIVPFFPIEAKKFKIKTYMIGLIFSIYSIGAFLSGIFLGKFMYIFDKNKLIFYCFSVHSVCLIVFGLLDLVAEKKIFILFSFICRILQGFSVGTLYTVVMSIMRGMYGNDFQGKIALLEMSIALGVLIGPVIASILFLFLDYLWIFIVFGIFVFFEGLIYLLIIKKMKKTEYSEFQEENVEKKKFKTIKYSDIFTRNITITYILMTFILNGINFIFPILSVNLKKRFNLTNSEVGFILLPTCFSYMATALIFQYLTKLNNKLKFFIGYIFLIVGLFFIAPHKDLFQGDYFWIVFLGLIFLGFSTAFLIIPVIPEFTILILNLKIPGVTNESINDMASGIFVSLNGISIFINPILGGILIDFFGFAKGQSVYIGIITILYLIYIIAGNGYEAFTKPIVFFDFEFNENKYIVHNDEKNESNISEKIENEKE